MQRCETKLYRFIDSYARFKWSEVLTSDCCRMMKETVTYYPVNDEAHRFEYKLGEISETELEDRTAELVLNSVFNDYKGMLFHNFKPSLPRLKY